MNYQFPAALPPFIAPVNSVSSCDEDAEFSYMERENNKFNTIDQKFTVKAPVGEEIHHPAKEETDDEEDEGIEDSEELQEVKDAEENNENNNESGPKSLHDSTESPDFDISDKSAFNPVQ
ncbi:uncharacterized protein [Battus philenor]|uniref:uncharacterized protein n=1 Tax=Battus philenor TaxID=42288 RepID=UPI0035D0505A